MRRSRTLTLDGITQPISEWALDFGILPEVIIARLERGWPVEQAITHPMVVAPGQKLPASFTTPPRRRRGSRPAAQKRTGRRFQHDGHNLTIADWSERTGIGVATINYRLRQGLTFEQAIGLTTMPRGPNSRQRLRTRESFHRFVERLRASKLSVLDLCNLGRPTS